MDKITGKRGKSAIKVLGILVILAIIFWVAKSLTTTRSQLTQPIQSNQQATVLSQEQTIFSQVEIVCSCIQSGDFSAADVAVEQLKKDFKNDPGLAEQLCRIVDKYEDVGAVGQAKSLNAKIAAGFPNNKYTSLQSAKFKIYEQIDGGHYKFAYSNVSTMIKDFAGNEQLPRRLYNIADRYDQRDAFDYSKTMCEEIVANYPKDEYASYASLQLLKLKAYEFIGKGDYKSAYEVVSTMMKDFPTHKQLAMKLYDIANKYDNADAFDYSKKVCEQIVANCPKDAYAGYASLQLLKLKAYELIDAKNYESAYVIVLQMTKDFSVNKQLPKRLWEVANRYDKRKNFDYSKLVCQQIVTNYPKDTYAGYASLQLLKLKAWELIDAGDYESAYTVALQMIKDFAGHKQLSRRLWEVADRFDQKDAYKYAKLLSSQIAAAYPDDKYGQLAALQVARINIYELIDAGKYDEAMEAVKQLALGFAGSEGLTKKFWEIANRLDKKKDFKRSKQLCEQIIANFPSGDEYVTYAKLQLAKLKAFELIETGNYEAAYAAALQMMTDFAGHKELSRRLYEIAQLLAEGDVAYGNALHDLIAANFSDDKYGLRSEIKATKLDIYKLIGAGNFEAVDIAISNLASAQYSSNQEGAAEELCTIAENYMFASGQIGKVRELYQKILELCQSDQNKDTLWAKGMEIRVNIALGNISVADIMEITDELIAEFPGNPDLSTALFNTGVSLHWLAWHKDTEDTKTYFEQATKILERLIREFPDSKEVPDAYYVAAGFYKENLEDYQKALNYFQKVHDNWPNFEYTWDVDYSIGECYLQLMRSGAIPKSEALPKMEEVYRNVVEKYPNSPFAEDALAKLGQINFEQAKFPEAVKCFEMLIEKEPNKVCLVGNTLSKAYKEIGNTENASRVQSEVENNCK